MRQLLAQRLVLVLAALCAALLVAPAALGVGISVPEVYKWEFTPNFETRMEFRVYNSHPTDVRVAIQLGNTLAPYANVSETMLDLTPSGQGTFFVYLKAPASLPSGDNRLDITAIEQAPPGKTISASTAVTVYLQLTVPYEGKFLRARLNVPSVSENSSVQAMVHVENLGTQDIGDAYADVTISNGGKEVASGQTDHLPLSAKSGVTLRATLTDALAPGPYDAHAFVHGDENQTETRASFIVGKKDVELLHISRQLVAGQVNAVQFSLRNRWNTALNQVRPTIYAGPVPRTAWRAVGPELTLYPLKDERFEYYMNVPNIQPGIYPGIVEVTFEGETKTWPVQFEVVPPPVVEAPAASAPGIPSIRLLLTGIFIVLVVLLLRRKEGPR